MSSFAIFAAVAVVVLLVVFVELAAAVLPVLIVVTMVPPEERQGLAEVMAAADSSRKLRLWPALRAAVAARRSRRRARAATQPSAETVSVSTRPRATIE